MVSTEARNSQDLLMFFKSIVWRGGKQTTVSCKTTSQAQLRINPSLAATSHIQVQLVKIMALCRQLQPISVTVNSKNELQKLFN